MWWLLTIALFLLVVLLSTLLFRRRRQAEETINALNEQISHLDKQKSAIEARLQAREHALFNNMIEGVLWLDSHRRIQLINSALSHLLGIQGKVEGRPLMEVARMPQLLEAISETEQNGQIKAYDLELTSLEDRHLEVNGAVIANDATGPQGLILVFHDLTRVNQLEKTRQEFVANVSHELRTPLSIIKGYIETLLDGAKDDPTVAERFLHIIQRHTARLTLLIEDLLTLSRLESGQIRLKFEPTDVKQLLDHVLEELSARTRQDNVTIHNDLPDGLSLTIDSNRIYQVFLNLLDNAIKYGRHPGNVWVRVEEPDPDRTTIAVQDDGPGIPAEAQERLFERFYRADSARSRERGGTGLGLAIVKHIIHSHHGKIWLDSHPDRGTTFYFSLPRQSDGVSS